MKRSESLISKKRYNAALDLLENGLKDFSADSAIRRRIEDIRRMRNKKEAKKTGEAQKEKTREITLSQAEWETLRLKYEKGVSFFQDRNFSGAITEWERVWNKYSGFKNVQEYLITACQYLGMEYYASHKYHEAIEVWQKILKISPDHAKATRYINRTKEELSKLEGLTN